MRLVKRRSLLWYFNVDFSLNAGARMVIMGWKNELGIRGRKEVKEDEGGYENGLIPCGTKNYGVM